MRSLINLKDVGMVQVKVLRAEGLMAADVTGERSAWATSVPLRPRVTPRQRETRTRVLPKKAIASASRFTRVCAVMRDYTALAVVVVLFLNDASDGLQKVYQQKFPL